MCVRAVPTLPVVCVLLLKCAAGQLGEGTDDYSRRVYACHDPFDSPRPATAAVAETCTTPVESGVDRASHCTGAADVGDVSAGARSLSRDFSSPPHHPLRQ